jgi:uncharacterized protein (TIGR03000 family)
MTALALILLLLAPGAPSLAGTPQAPAAAARTAVLVITAPDEDAEITVDGYPVEGAGRDRSFESPPLDRERTYQYTVVAKWAPNTYTNMTRTKVVTFRAGDRVIIDLSVDDPTDRVVVSYVPTPNEIAAVKAGARRAVGIDLDPARVKESRANVAAAGLTDRIDIRLGDALEQPDLGSMTVVFLYMGDHFNLLIRPYLWKQLPVGARVVSHRFLMGDDWPPDKTITVTSDNGLPYELHLWTITEAHKRRP